MATTTRDLVLVRVERPAVRITLNRPDRRNALSLALMEDLTGVLVELGADPEVRAIEGVGPVFSAGHDLGEMIGREAAFYRKLFDACTVMMETIHRVPQPVIDKVHGIATAAGCQLVAACDLALAAEATRFATPGVRGDLLVCASEVSTSSTRARTWCIDLLVVSQEIGQLYA